METQSQSEVWLSLKVTVPLQLSTRSQAWLYITVIPGLMRWTQDNRSSKSTRAHSKSEASLPHIHTQTHIHTITHTQPQPHNHTQPLGN